MTKQGQPGAYSGSVSQALTYRKPRKSSMAMQFIEIVPENATDGGAMSLGFDLTEDWHKACWNCLYFDGTADADFCKHWQAKPPLRVMVQGCDAHDDTDNIPF